MYLILLLLINCSINAEEIKVISERSIKNISDTVSDITIFDEYAIRDSGASTVKEFLQQESDIHIFSPGVGQPESVQIRGNDSRHTLILVDGQSIGDITGTDGSARLESVSLQSIAKIEVIKGSESVLYGSQAIGGVINIITDKKKSGGAFSWKTGSYRLRNAALDYKRVKNDWSFSMYSNIESRKDFSVRPEKAPYHHDNDRTQKVNLGLNIKKYTEDSTFQFSFKKYNNKYDYDSIATDERDDHSEYNNTLYGLSYEKKLNNKFKYKFNLNRTEVDRELYGVDSNTDYIYIYKGETHKLDFIGELKDKDYHVSFGADALEERALALDTKLSSKKDRSQFSIFANNDLNIGNAILASGIRVTKVQSNKAIINYKLGSLVKLNELSWRTNITTGFKTPSLYNLYATFGGNRSLKVEKARTLSSSIGHRNRVFGNSLFSIFRSQYRNYIDYNLSTSSYNNIARAVIKGYDLSWQKSWPKLFKTSISYTYLNTKNLDTNKYLNQRAKNTIKAKLHYYLTDKINFGATYRYVGERDDTAGISPSYDLFDTTVNFNRITLSIKNVFDRDYQELGGYQTFGRNYFIGWKYIL
jgi:vitamin B12 transporter